MTVLHTERLTLRALIPADAEAYAALRSHPDVAKWLLTPPGDPVTAAHASIERFAAAWRERRHAPWGIFREGRLIGHGGLNYVQEFEATEVLWALHPEAWRQGYATEAARAAMEYGFEVLKLGSIFAITKPDNFTSQAVMTRLGMLYRKNVLYRNIEVRWFDIDREAWKA